MSTRMYLIYEPDSGKAVHLHIEERGLHSTSDEVLQAAGFGTDGRLAVLDIAASELPTRPVRVENGELRELDEADDMGMGGAAQGCAEPDVERRYKRLDRPRK